MINPFLVTRQALARVQEQLLRFSNEPMFMFKLSVAFGSGFSRSAALGLQAAWQQGNFSVIPPIELLPASVLGNAVGAYASGTDRIYLSRQFLVQQSNALGRVVSVLLEEIGHKIDCLLNPIETPGDEGAIFAGVVLGQPFSAAKLSQLRAENDWAVIELDGQRLAVEQAVIDGDNNDNLALNGTDLADTIRGFAGNDDLYGFGANDFLDGGTGNDRLYGGRSTISGTDGLGNDTLLGGDGNDELYEAGPGSDSIDGGTGNDFLSIFNSAETANITVTYTTATNGLISGGVKNGTTLKNVERILFYSGSGNDTVNFSAAAGGSQVNGGAGNDIITTGSGNDFLYGEAGNDTLTAGTGNDSLYGQEGSDSITASTGNDDLEGGDSSDTLTGGSGNDNLYGQDGNDLLNGGTEADNLYGGSDNDRIDGGTGNDRLYGGGAAISGTDGLGTDTLLGGDGNDELYEAGPGSDSIDGGTGNDFLSIFNSAETANITVTYTTATNGLISGGVKNGTTLKNVERILFYSGSGNDTVNFSAAAGGSQINGGAGNDIITTGSGNDFLYGEAGNDTLTGGNGSDLLYGGVGNDRLNSGTGNDSLLGEAGNDNLIGGGGKDTLSGGEGTDSFTYAARTDSLLANFDIITDYTSGEIINAPGAIGNTSLTTSVGNASSLGTADIATVLTNSIFTANSARAFTITGQSGSIFIALNDSTPGFNAATDAIIQLQNYTLGSVTIL
jgi:Ca2+-binding RTX toxin-like protein